MHKETTMRRTLALALALALWAAPFAVHAQPVLYGPGGLVNSSGASVSVTNTATATSIYSYSVPGGMVQGNFAPLHLRLVGVVSTNPSSGGVGNFDVGCNFGGSTASIALVNAGTLDNGLSSAPIMIDLFLTGYTAVQANGVKESLQGVLNYQSGTATQPKQYSAQVQGTTALSTQTLTCIWKWASAATTNSLIIYNGRLSAGD
jgi:hypothetical protein